MALAFASETPVEAAPEAVGMSSTYPIRRELRAAIYSAIVE